MGARPSELGVANAGGREPRLTWREAKLPEIMQLRRDVLDWPMGTDQRDQSGGPWHVAAFDGDRIVGTASLAAHPCDRLTAERYQQFFGVAVDAHYQRMHIGQGLMDRIVERARATPSSCLWAQARDTALPFYDHLGFLTLDGVFPAGPAAVPHHIIWKDI